MPEIRDSFRYFFIDIYASSNLRELAFVLGKAVFESLRPKERRFLDHFIAVIASLRAAFKIDLNVFMTEADNYIHTFISQGEGLEVEFKESYDSLSLSVFETD